MRKICEYQKRSKEKGPFYWLCTAQGDRTFKCHYDLSDIKEIDGKTILSFKETGLAQCVNWVPRKDPRCFFMRKIFKNSTLMGVLNSAGAKFPERHLRATHYTRIGRIKEWAWHPKQIDAFLECLESKRELLPLFLDLDKNLNKFVEKALKGVAA